MRPTIYLVVRTGELGRASLSDPSPRAARLQGTESLGMRERRRGGAVRSDANEDMSLSAAAE
jgi:hypothetical protein